MCDGGGPMALQVKAGIQQPIVGDISPDTNRIPKAINALQMEEWRKVRIKKKLKVARSNDKLVTKARVIYKRKTKDDKVERYECRLVA